jgi:hypothetical protein
MTERYVSRVAKTGYNSQSVEPECNFGDDGFRSDDPENHGCDQ